MFLSDLLNRIDKIAVNSKKIMETEKQAKKLQRQTGKAAKNEDKRANTRSAKALKPNSSAPEPQGVTQSRKRSQKVQVTDHPMAYQAFNALQDSGKSQSPRQNRSSKSAAQSNPRRRTPRPSGNAQTKQRRTPTRTDRQASKPVQQKAITSGPLEPKVSADTFLYGKVLSVSPSLASRVASVTKDTLIKSHYPYKLPKSIIQSLDDAPKNRFIAQADYNIQVDGQELAEQINQVVRGQTTELDIGPADQFLDKEQERMAKFAQGQLMKNGDLDISSKKLIFSVASGLQSPKSLLDGKHWVK